MSERHSATPIGKKQPGVGIGVGVGVGVGAERSTSISIRVGTTLMKSVSIFLTSGRKASGKRTQIFAGELPRRRRKKMPDEGSGRNSAYIAKMIESLKKKTRFSK